MKTSFKLSLTALSLVLAVFVGIQHPFMALVCFVLTLNIWLDPKPVAEMGTLTLILQLLTQKFIAAFKTKVIPMAFISTDLGRDNGADIAEPVKFNQEVISHLALIPTVSVHTPGEDLEQSPQLITDLATDLFIKIDRAMKVVIKIPTSTSVTAVLDGLIDAAVAEAGMALGRAILSDVFTSTVTPANFTNVQTEQVINADFDTLRAARVQLNTQAAGDERYGVTGSQFLSNISDDQHVASANYYNQRLAGDPYLSLVNIQGFKEVREWPNFDPDNSTIGTFTAVASTNVITTSAAHGLNIGDRVRFSSTTTLPAGLSAATNYFVISVPSTTTLTVSATAGGSVVDITDTGTGTHSIQSYGQLNAFFFEKRAIHMVMRQLQDNLALAQRLGIPQIVAQHTEVDSDTGAAITVYAWMKAGTQDIYLAFTAAYGCKGGRGLAAASGVDPGSLAAGAGMDRAGLRVIEA